MFAIIKTGGKQYKVSANDIIQVEKLLATNGDSVEFTDVLMMGKESSVKIGAPFVKNARVCGTVMNQFRDDKILIFKKKRRHNYRRKNGHRQYLTLVRITDILGEGESPKPKTQAPKAEAKKIETNVEAKPTKAASPKVETKSSDTTVKKPAPKAAKTTKPTSNKK